MKVITASTVLLLIAFPMAGEETLGIQDSYQVAVTTLARTTNVSERHRLALKISDMLWSSDGLSEITTANDQDHLEAGLESLQEIINSTVYSEYLADAWVKWRYRTQLYWHGASNRSIIPNDVYNRKRQEIILIIKRHLERRPGDARAKRQLKWLADYSDLVPLNTGNSAVVEWAVTE